MEVHVERQVSSLQSRDAHQGECVTTGAGAVGQPCDGAGDSALR